MLWEGAHIYFTIFDSQSSGALRYWERILGLPLRITLPTLLCAGMHSLLCFFHFLSIKWHFNKKSHILNSHPGDSLPRWVLSVIYIHHRKPALGKIFIFKHSESFRSSCIIILNENSIQDQTILFLTKGQSYKSYYVWEEGNPQSCWILRILINKAIF